MSFASSPAGGGNAMAQALASALALLGIGCVAASAAVFGMRSPAQFAQINPVFTETQWPFALDQWGTGKAFVCLPADCGAKVAVYVRPKIGFCNCSTGVSDDPE